MSPNRILIPLVLALAVILAMRLAGVFTVRPALSSENLSAYLEPSSPSAEPVKQRISFSSDRYGRQQIYVMNTDSSNLVKLTDNISDDLCPSFSPDGAKIVFTSNRDGKGEIYVMNSDGTGRKRLTFSQADAEKPVWSPDGTRIAFEAIWQSNIIEIYIMHADGSNMVQITEDMNGCGHPTWSPLSNRIAFQSATDNSTNYEIYFTNIDGTGRTHLVRGVCPAWSPDGHKLAFVYCGDDECATNDIFTINLDGTNQTRITKDFKICLHPVWSPDGTQIIFHSNYTGYDEAYIVSSAGGGKTRLTYSTYNNYPWSWWSPK